MQDSNHLTIILYSSVIKIVISQKQKFSGAILRCFIIIFLENMNKIKMYLYFIHVFQEK
jgi:hypothetical protein